MKTKKQQKLYFTGGGTGGHVFPGIAVAEEWCRQNSVGMNQLLWIGSGKKMERDICARFGMPYKAIICGKLRRYFSFQNLLDFFKVGVGFIQVYFFLLFHRPTAIFSKGGYVTVAPCLAAKMLGIPFISHESDLTPGLATKINSRFAKEILTAYPETCEMIRKSVPCKAVGNPVRKEITEGSKEEGLKLAQVPEGKKVVLVLGGSLGAANLNRLVIEAASYLQEDYYFIHQTGEQNAKELEQEKAEGKIPSNMIQFPFINAELPHFLACADLVVSRAGAGTLWENVATGNPAILVPLGTASSRGDQIVNAQYFEKRGAAVVMDEETATGELLSQRIASLLSDKNIYDKMKKSVSDIANNHAASDIVMEIKKYFT